MKLFQIQYFCTACEQKSITKAAALLYVSQPSVSAAIHALEEEFGCRLIKPNSHGFTLTENGEYFYRRASQILISSCDLVRDMSTLSKKRGVVCLGATPMLGACMLPLIYRTLPRDGPDTVHLHLLDCGESNILEMLKSGRIDFALVPVDNLAPDLYEVMNLGTFEYVLAVPKGHRLANRQSVSIQDLGGESFVLFDDNGFFGTRFHTLFEKNQTQLNVLCLISRVYTVKEFVAQGVALSFLLADLMKDESSLCGVPLNPPVQTWGGLIWQKSKSFRPAEKIFLKYMSKLAYSYNV